MTVSRRSFLHSLAAFIVVPTLGSIIPGARFRPEFLNTQYHLRKVVGTVSLDDALRIYFSDPIIENLVAHSEIISIFDKRPRIEKTSGRWVETAQRFEIHPGVGVRREQPDLVTEINRLIQAPAPKIITPKRQLWV